MCLPYVSPKKRKSSASRDDLSIIQLNTPKMVDTHERRISVRSTQKIKKKSKKSKVEGVKHKMINQYRIVKELGRGSYSEVFLC